MGIGVVETQFHCLRNARNLMNEEIQLNNLAMIDNCFSKANLTSKFTYTWIKKTYKHSIANRCSLPENFSKINQSFIHHLDRHVCKLGVYLFIHKVEVILENSWIGKLKEIKDVWLANIQNGFEGSGDLLSASMHVDDILFGCEAILVEHLENGQEFIERELTPFIEEKFPHYLSILPEQEDKLKEDLTQQFKDLKDFISKGQISLAKEKLSLIQQFIKK